MIADRYMALWAEQWLSRRSAIWDGEGNPAGEEL